MQYHADTNIGRIKVSYIDESGEFIAKRYGLTMHRTKVWENMMDWLNMHKCGRLQEV